MHILGLTVRPDSEAVCTQVTSWQLYTDVEDCGDI